MKLVEILVGKEMVEEINKGVMARLQILFLNAV